MVKLGSNGASMDISPPLLHLESNEIILHHSLNYYLEMKNSGSLGNISDSKLSTQVSPIVANGEILNAILFFSGSYNMFNLLGL